MELDEGNNLACSNLTVLGTMHLDAGTHEFRFDVPPTSPDGRHDLAIDCIVLRLIR